MNTGVNCNVGFNNKSSRDVSEITSIMYVEVNIYISGVCSDVTAVKSSQSLTVLKQEARDVNGVVLIFISPGQHKVT